MGNNTNFADSIIVGSRTNVYILYIWKTSNEKKKEIQPRNVFILRNDAEPQFRYS